MASGEKYEARAITLRRKAENGWQSSLRSSSGCITRKRTVLVFLDTPLSRIEVVQGEGEQLV
jgi:hypothetical protein